MTIWSMSLRLGLPAILAGVVAACAPKAKDKSGEHRGGSADLVAAPVLSWDGAAIEQFEPSINASGDAEALAIALSSCECSSREVAKILRQDATSRGVMPQVFVPLIRQSVVTNSKLQALLALPSGLQGPLKSWLATDEKVAKEIRVSFSEKFNISLRSLGGTTLESRLPFRFDLFSPVSSTANSFSVKQQVARWNLVLARKSLWNGGKPIDGVDHGLSLIAFLRAIGEWTYMIGLGSDALPNGYGGLALDIRSGNQKPVIPYDPANAPKGAGAFAAGSFAISYPNESSVDMATKVREAWSYTPDEVSLRTQAGIWRAAAYAFANMRLDTSPNASKILTAQDGAISISALQLPLVWLRGMAELLEQKFINRAMLTIRQNAYGDESLADLESLLLLGDAIRQWRESTQNLSQSGLKPNIQNLLLDVPQRLMEPLQLTTQRIISQYTFVSNGTTPSARVYVGIPAQRSSERLAAMTIGLLAQLEQSSLTSKELKLKVFNLFISHAQDWVGKAEQLDAATVIEQFRATDVMTKYQDAPRWTAPLRDKLKAAVEKWGGS